MLSVYNSDKNKRTTRKKGNKLGFERKAQILSPLNRARSRNKTMEESRYVTVERDPKRRGDC